MIISELEGSLFSALIKIGGIRIEDEALIKLHMNYEDNNGTKTAGDIILDKPNANEYMVPQSTIKYNRPAISEIDVYTSTNHYHCTLHRNIEFKPGYMRIKLEFPDDIKSTECLCTVLHSARGAETDPCSVMKYENDYFANDYSYIMQVYQKVTRTRGDIIRFASCIIRALNQNFCEQPVHWDEIIKSDNDPRFKYTNFPPYDELVRIVYNILAYNIGYSNYHKYMDIIQFTIIKEIAELTAHIYKSYILRIFKEILLGTNGSGIIRNEDGSATIKFIPPECDEASGEEPHYSKDMEFNITVSYYDSFIDAILLRNSNVHNFSYPNKSLDIL